MCHQQFEDSFNSLVGWWFKLFCFKIYFTHWSAVLQTEHQYSGAGLKLLCTTNAVLIICKHNSLMNSGTWIHKKSIHKWIQYRNLSYDFLNSWIWIHTKYFTTELKSQIQNTAFLSIFSTEFMSMNSYPRICVCEFKVYIEFIY